MPTNTSIQSSLVAGSVPPDRDCPKSGQDVVNLVQDFVSVQTTSEDGTPTGPDNSIAEQALNTANTALGAVQELQSAQKETRSSGLIPVSNGNTEFTWTFSPPMPSTDYDISTMVYAGTSAVTADRCLIRVVESSITMSSFTLRLDDFPLNHKIAIRIVQR